MRSEEQENEEEEQEEEEQEKSRPPAADFKTPYLRIGMLYNADHL